MRAPDGEPLKWKVDADVEALAWAPHVPTTFLVSTEDGLVCAYDARSGPGTAPLFRLSAHDAATSAMSFNPALPNLMATASTDMKVGPACHAPPGARACARSPVGSPIGVRTEPVQGMRLPSRGAADDSRRSHDMCM